MVFIEAAWREFLFLRLLLRLEKQMVVVAQLVRASDCGSEGRRFEPGHPPSKTPSWITGRGLFLIAITLP